MRLKWVDMDTTFCRSCQYASNDTSHVWGQTISDTTRDVKRLKMPLFHNFLTFDDILADWLTDKLCRSCHLTLINKSYQVNLIVAFEIFSKSLRRVRWSLCVFFINMSRIGCISITNFSRFSFCIIKTNFVFKVFQFLKLLPIELFSIEWPVPTSRSREKVVPSFHLVFFKKSC
jgi:hypothetical protein